MTDSYLTSNLTCGRTIVTFATDVTPDVMAADPDALHVLHVSRVRDCIAARRVEWYATALGEGSTLERRVIAADHLPTGRVVMQDGRNMGAVSASAAYLRRSLARIDARMLELTEHFDGEGWADAERLDLDAERAGVLAELEPHELVRRRSMGAARRRAHYRRNKPGYEPPAVPEDQAIRRDALLSMGRSGSRNLMDEPIGALTVRARALRQAVAA